jgi:hypothetical protein
MAGIRFELHASRVDHGPADEAVGEKVGLPELLADRAIFSRQALRAHRAHVPGTAAIEGYRWRFRDRWTQTWWPQGVSAGEYEGVPLAMATWFAKPRRGVEMGSRLTVLDLRTLRYHHILLVSPRRARGGIEYDPVKVHAGGMVWSGDRLFVAATFGGIREFRLTDIRLVPKPGVYGYRYVLPEFASYEPPAGVPHKMRYSFISLESAAGDDDLRLVSGEYGKPDTLRLARMRLGSGQTVIDEMHVPGIPQMQGAVVRDGTWFVNASRGDKHGGDLWVGKPGAMIRHAGVLPPGPEDLAIWPERNQLWSVTEFPGKRWIFAMDAAAWAGPK